MNAHRSVLVLAAAAVLACGLAPRAARAQGDSPEVTLNEGRRLFEALDYERALPLLDRAITLFEARTPRDPATRAQLAEAYEMRARSRFGVADREGARADFHTMIRLDPPHMLTGKVSPNVVALFEQARKALVGDLNLSVTPGDAEVQIDGSIHDGWQMLNGRVPTLAGRLPMVAGTHAITVAKPGYRTATQTIVVTAATATDLTVALERVSAIVSVATAPPAVDVVVDGRSQGVTAAGPPPPDYPTGDIAPADLSKPLLVVDLATGTHDFEFRKPCYVPATRRLDVQKPADYRMDPVKLVRAVGRIAVGAAPGGTVFLDGEPRGNSPTTIADVCEGPHVVEVRAPFGRYLTRLDVHTGDDLKLVPTLKPAIALLSTVGLPEGLRGADPRQAVEKSFQGLRAMTLLALPSDDVAAALAREKLSPGWLSFDTARHPIGDAAANIMPAVRLELSERLARSLDVQGLAVLTVLSKDDQSRLLLTLLAAGSRDPDTLDIRQDDPASIGRAVSKLESSPPLFRTTVGIQAIDVLDQPGPVVVGVASVPGVPQPAVAPGEVITGANGQAVPDVAHLDALVNAVQPGSTVAVDVRDRGGASRKVDLKAGRVPDAIALDDQMLSSNALLVNLRRRLDGASPEDEPIVRLNVAIALMRVGNWGEARAQLEKVRLPDGPGVAAGTVQYLLGLCREAAGEFAEAETAWRAAAASKDATITSEGPPVRHLAERKLAELARRVRLPQ